MKINSTLSLPCSFDYTPSISSICSKSQEILDIFKENVGSIVRDKFFLPLAGKISEEDQKRLQKETRFSKDFWDLEKPCNPHLPYHLDIKKHFLWKKETTEIQLHGKKLQVEYSIIEPRKSSSKPTQNIVCLLGNLSTIDNNIVAAYPFLASYLEKAQKDSSIAPIRLISLSQYSTTHEGLMHKAKTLDESGEILTEVLQKITENKGPIKQIIAQSLGTIILAAALKYAAQVKDLLPSNIYFDRGPSSIEKTSEQLGLSGWVFLQLAKFSGWDIDLGFEIQKHLSHRPQQNVFISAVSYDHFFSGQSSLCNSPHLQNLTSDQGFQKLSFDFAAQLYTERAHHNVHNGLLDGHHLMPRQPNLLKNEETMADKVMHALTKPTPKWKSLFRFPLFKK